MKKLQMIISVSIFLLFLFWMHVPLSVYADEDPTVIVIDPGHGGDNLGAEFDTYTEKNMTMTVALAMKEELEKYDNVIVYLTREGDKSMSIKDRALFAKEKNADFLFCLHFNSSVNHNLYGAEVWVSAFGDYYVLGRQFAEINMQLFEEMGLFSRGIKVRLNDSDDNYYGILRYCTDLGVPSVLIEHCHLDNSMDFPFYQKGEDQLKEFGRKDAEAVAKYFGLTSSLTGADYSNFPKTDISYQEIVRPDKTEPEECFIEVLSVNEKEATASVAIHAKDADSYIQYYNYSLDGGNTWSELLSWPRTYWNSSEDDHVFTVQLPFDQDIELRAAAYNGYDVFTESNIVMIPAIASPETPSPSAVQKDTTAIETYKEITYESSPDESYFSRREKAYLILLILLISLIMAGILYAMVRMILKLKKYNNRHREP